MSAKYLNAYVKLSDSLHKVERATRDKYARIRFETNQIEQENVEIARERMWLLIISIVVIILNDWILFLLILSVFWLVRSLGETIYWLNQQFSKINRNPPKKFWTFKFFPQDSLWFIHQIFWQCIAVISIIFTIYFAKIWLTFL